MLDWDYAERRHVPCASGAFLFLRRIAIENVGLFDERFFMYYEETDWFVRAQRLGWRALYLPSLEVVHEVGGSSTSRNGLSLLFLESQNRYAEKHFGWLAALGLQICVVGIDFLLMVRGAFRSPAFASVHPFLSRARVYRRGRRHEGGK